MGSIIYTLVTRGGILPLHDGGDVGEVGEATEAISAAFLPPIFVGTTLVSLFLVSPPSPYENASGCLYIVAFRSS
jgi:hypothetical protein